MANKEREQLLQEAQAVELALGVDFQKNISNGNLRKLIDEKKAELESQLKSDSDDKKKSSNDEIFESVATAIMEDKSKLFDFSEHDQKIFAEKVYPEYKTNIEQGEPTDEELKFFNQIEVILGIREASDQSDTENKDDNPNNQENKETYEDEMIIKRVSKCGGYKTNIKGLKEAARRSGITVKEVKEALESGKPVATGETFTEV